MLQSKIEFRILQSHYNYYKYVSSMRLISACFVFIVIASDGLKSPQAYHHTEVAVFIPVTSQVISTMSHCYCTLGWAQ